MRDHPGGDGTSELVLRSATPNDIEALIVLNRLCFPSAQEENIVWNSGQLNHHLQLFPEGQVVAVLDGLVVGAVSSLIINMGVDPYRAHTFAGVTDGGYFHNHDPLGDTLYGADVYVHPDYRSRRIGHALYQARRELCRRLNLRRILAGGRLQGYASVSDTMSPEEYVRAVESGARRDQVLNFQLREGFVVRKVMRNYIRDPQSRNCATLIEWLNPDYRVRNHTSNCTVRVACVQYQMRRINDFADFASQVDYFVDAAARYRADFVLLPELMSMSLLSQERYRLLDARVAMLKLATMESEYCELMSRLAQKYGIHLIAGSHPMKRHDKLLNVCPMFFPDGHSIMQPKLHVTPAEKLDWGLSGGNELFVIPTAKAKVGILICYDSEFPEPARYLADRGAELLFVPYCTDTRAGYLRVRSCSQARAIENQVYVATAGVIGNLPGVEAMDINYGRAAVFTPCDFEFARDGIQAEADHNVEMLLVTDLDMNSLYRSRTAGSVTPRIDRRVDLFEYRAHLPATGSSALDSSPPLDPESYLEVRVGGE
jgi:predicted amidohydrolase/GNAT superfamily N-acetyltransferase